MAQLRAEQLSVSIDGTPILAPLDVQLRSGEVLAVIGPNGAGKSTLLRALLGLVPHAGRVLINDRDTSNWDAATMARQLAWVPQSSAITAPVSVRTIVGQGRFAHRSAWSLRLGTSDHSAITEALAASDCTHLAERDFTSLSGGEQQRVLLARALATGADFLLLDEPTAHLDPAHTLAVLRIVRSLAEAGRGVLIALHQLEHALRFADRVLLLCCGQTICDDVPEAVITPERIAEVFGVSLHHDGLRYAELEAET